MVESVRAWIVDTEGEDAQAPRAKPVEGDVGDTQVEQADFQSCDSGEPCLHRVSS